jgi:hypothetical protein
MILIQLKILRRNFGQLLLILVIISVQTVVAADDPKTPTISVIPELLWQIGEDDDESGVIFGLVVDVCIDQDLYLYVVDRQLSTVSLFNSDGEFLRDIGRDGDGPGEYRRPYDAYSIASGEVGVVGGNGRNIFRYSRSGTHLGNILVPENTDGTVRVVEEIQAVGSTLFALSRIGEVTTVVTFEPRVDLRRIHALDSNFEEQVTFFEESHLADESKPVWSERPTALHDRWIAARDGSVYVATSFLDYEVTAYNADGTVRYVSRPDYRPRKRSSDEKQAVYDWATVNPHGNLPGTDFQIEEYDKSIMKLPRVHNGNIWVLTSRGFYDRPEGSIGVYDILDTDGKLVKKVALVCEGDPENDRIYFAGNRMYVLSCFRSAVASMVGSDKGHLYSDSCKGNMTIDCYQLPEH